MVVTTSKGAQSGSRLGTRLRGKLAEAYSSRGYHKSSLWYVYSPRTDRDWILKGDLEWGHFLLAESDPRISQIDYAPIPEIVRVGDDDHATTLDSIVTFKDNTIEWREIKHANATSKDIRAQHQWEAQVEAAAQKGVRYARYTENEIFSCPQRIANWARIVAWMSAVRGRSLYLERVAILALLDSRGSASIAEIQELGTGAESACFIAAAFKGVQDGLFECNLDDQPLSKNITLRCIEGRI